MRPAHTTVVTSRRRWVYQMLRRSSTPPPAFGSRDWLALPEGSVAKVNAVIRAAECWARDGDNLEANLRREVEDARRAFLAAEDDDYRARAAAHRQQWKRIPTQSFTERREAQLRTAQPRPSDRPGRRGGAA